MRRSLIVVLALVFACDGDKGTTDTDSGDTTVDTPDDTVATPTPDDETGSLTDTAPETGRPALSLDDLAFGDLVITELMLDSDVCADEAARFVELRYLGDGTVDLAGLLLQDASGTTTPIAGTKVVAPGDRVVLLQDPPSGGAHCYGFSAPLTFPASVDLTAGVLGVRSGSALLDGVDWSRWTLPTGASLSLDPRVEDAMDNDDAEVWCAATTAIPGSTDLGTPGDANDDCPIVIDTSPPVPTGDTSPPSVIGGELLLSEVADPASDADLRFVEIHNPGPNPVDLDGWRLERYSNMGTTPQGVDLGPGLLMPGASWVVANTGTTPTDFANAFGRAPDQQSGQVQGNGDDVYTLVYDDGTGPSLVDIYGEIGAPSAPWDYLDQIAVRRDCVTAPATAWTGPEWVLVDELAASPGIHPAGFGCGDTGDTGLDTGSQTGSTGLDDTGPTPLTPADLSVGDLLITEFMSDAGDCADTDSEYVEILVRVGPLDLFGLELSDASTTVTVADHVVVQAGSYVALHRQTANQCYGLDGASYPTLSLNNSGGDTISVGANGVAFHTIDFTTWDITTGAAKQLDPSATPLTSTLPSSWCDSPDAIVGSTDFGSPGAENPSCTPPGPTADTGLPTADTGVVLATADTGPPTADTGVVLATGDTGVTVLVPTADTGLATADTGLATADIGLATADTGSSPTGGILLLSEVSDWGPDSDLRYVEISNIGLGPVDLTGWELWRYTNGASAPSSTGTLSLPSQLLAPGDAFVIGKPAGSGTFTTVFGSEPDVLSGVISGNGNDAYGLVFNGTLIDVYGVVGTDGTGTPWDYVDQVAQRAGTVTGPTTAFDVAEWSLSTTATSFGVVP
jgi:hypothetical protein